MTLSKSDSTTTTANVRRSLRTFTTNEGLDRHPVELVQFHVLILCTEGEGRHMVDFVDYEMRPGTAIWIRPGQVQRWDDEHDGFEAELAVFASESVPDLPLFDRFLDWTAVSMGDDADGLRQLMGWMRDDLASNGDEPTVASAISVLLRLFTRRTETGAVEELSASRRLASAFVESIEHNIEQRTVSWHAGQIGASTRTLARATAESFGQRPKDIIDSHVILEAQRRLAWSDEDISTIARSLRFSEASNFTKFFRARTGMSPSSFRDAAPSLSA